MPNLTPLAALQLFDRRVVEAIDRWGEHQHTYVCFTLAEARKLSTALHQPPKPGA